jgi:hypothetical protein
LNILQSGIYCIQYPTCEHHSTCKKIPIDPVLAEEVAKAQLEEPMVPFRPISKEDEEAFWEKAEKLFRSRRYNIREMFNFMNETGTKNAFIIHHKSITEKSLYSQLVLRTDFKIEKDSGVSEMIFKLLERKRDAHVLIE